MKTINPILQEDEQAAPTVIAELTRVLARMLVEERLKKEFRRLRPMSNSKVRTGKPLSRRSRAP